MYHIFLIHSSVDGHLGSFHVLAIVNSTAINTGVHVSFWVTVLPGYMPRSGITGSDDGSIFSFLRNFHRTSTLQDLTNLYSHQCRRGPFCLHPLQQSDADSISTEVIMWSLPFILLMWHITLIIFLYWIILAFQEWIPLSHSVWCYS